jgi:hypothetical protein
MALRLIHLHPSAAPHIGNCTASSSSSSFKSYLEPIQKRPSLFFWVVVKYFYQLTQNENQNYISSEKLNFVFYGNYGFNVEWNGEINWMMRFLCAFDVAWGLATQRMPFHGHVVSFGDGFYGRNNMEKLRHQWKFNLLELHKQSAVLCVHFESKLANTAWVHEYCMKSTSISADVCATAAAARVCCLPE